MKRLIASAAVLGSAVCASPSATAQPRAALEHRASVTFTLSTRTGLQTVFLEAYQPVLTGPTRVVMRTSQGSRARFETPTTYGGELPPGALTVDDDTAELRMSFLGMPLHVEWAAASVGSRTAFTAGFAAYQGVWRPAPAVVELGPTVCDVRDATIGLSVASDPADVLRPLASAPPTRAVRCTEAKGYVDDGSLP